MRRAVALGLGLAILALPLAACGHGDDQAPEQPAASPPPDSAQEPIPAADFSKLADAICTRTAREAERLRERIASQHALEADSGSAVLAKTLIEPGLEIRERQAERTRALPPPVDGGRAYRTYVGLFDPMNELLRMRLQIGLDGGVVEAQDLEALIAQLGDEQRLAARELGLKGCDEDLLAIVIPPAEP